MGVANHEEVQGDCGKLLHAHHLAAEGGCILVFGLGDRVVCLQDQVDREPSTLDLAHVSHLIQNLAEYLHISVAAMSQSLLCDEDTSAPTMCNPTCDGHPRPRLQGFNFMRFSGEVILGPHSLLAVHGIDDDHQDSRIEFPRRKAKVPI